MFSDRFTHALAAAARQLNSPTTGPFAAALHELCSSNYNLTPDRAATLYRACGYVPFRGYPLTRLDNRPAPVSANRRAYKGK